MRHVSSCEAEQRRRAKISVVRGTIHCLARKAFHTEVPRGSGGQGTIIAGLTL